MSTSHIIRAHAQEVQTKIKGGCQLGRKVVPHDFKSDLPLALAETKSANDNDR